jgi:hypothetical protein
LKGVVTVISEKSLLPQGRIEIPDIFSTLRKRESKTLTIPGSYSKHSANNDRTF